MLPRIPLFTPFYSLSKLQGLPGIFTVFTQRLPSQIISHALSTLYSLLPSCLSFPTSFLGLPVPVPFLGPCSPTPFLGRRSASRRPLTLLVDRIPTLQLSDLLVYLSFAESSALLSIYLSLQYFWRSVIPDSVFTRSKNSEPPCGLLLWLLSFLQPAIWLVRSWTLYLTKLSGLQWWTKS